MAHHFDQHFREMLLREPINRGETELPSPWALRRKILIKNRKLPADSDTVKHNICDKDDADDKQFQDFGFDRVYRLSNEIFMNKYKSKLLSLEKLTLR